jgi:hypothetical protein
MKKSFAKLEKGIQRAFRPVTVPCGTTSVNIQREKFMLRPKV